MMSSRASGLVSIGLRRAVLLLLGLLLGWMMLEKAVTDHAAIREAQKRGDTTALAYPWALHHAPTNFNQVMAELPDDPVAARRRLEEVYRQNPVNPRPLLALARFAQADGDLDLADALVRQAIRLAPASPAIRNEAAVYWATRGDLARAVRHWSLAVEADPARRQAVFAVLLTLLEEPETRYAIRPLALDPPPWWEAFFAQVARRAISVETVRALYGLRREALRMPPSSAEREAYVARLQRDGLIAEAYLVWVNGLTESQRRHLGLLFDGGFELEPTQSGFGWQTPRSARVEVRFAPTYGVEGARALQLRFRQREQAYRHLYQTLFLDPGYYRVSGQVRLDSLTTIGGLRWQLDCVQPSRTRLGESERFLGSGDWRTFSFELAVPDGCGLQEIRLVSTGRRPFEHRLDGDVWFDGMSLRRVSQLGAVARMRNQVGADGDGMDTDADSSPDESPSVEADDQQDRE
ncbi:hypothetical protein ABC977_03545 [Thioalkalicoccus limnaeus]|uniref:Tetratricopeptide repeat protein n=1 Tax=Thioalkalicoccus limnaeus TaxID=120681 RepID=A0ABV4BAK9_9GAMM